MPDDNEGRFDEERRTFMKSAAMSPFAVASGSPLFDTSQNGPPMFASVDDRFTKSDSSAASPVFSDDFSTNTLSDYDIRQTIITPYMGRDGRVSYSASNEWLYIYSPNNIRMHLTREDIPIPDSGHIRVELEVLRDYHRTNRLAIELREDEQNKFGWHGTGHEYGNRIVCVQDGEQVLRKEGPGTVGPSSNDYVLDMYWTESSMSLAVNGEEQLSGSVDTSSIDPTMFEILNAQGKTRLKSVALRSGDAEEEPATLTDVTLPPTAVETGEEPTFDVTVDPGTYSPDELAVEASTDLTRRGEDVASASASVTATETEDGQIRFQGSIPSASSLAARPEGVGFETTIRVLADETAVETFESVRTFAFRQVDRVGAIAAHASDTTPSRNGRDLFEFLRRRAEFVNEHYASGLGNMGAKGFAIELLNERDSETDPFAVEWFELPKQVSEYETQRARNLPDENVREFVQTSLEAFNSSDGADVADYDTAMVVNPQALSRPNWQGSIPPTARFEIPKIDFEIRTPTEVPLVEIAPYDLADGEQIDAIYATADDDAWSHEFGHAMGPGLQVGFPEMYKMDSFNNFGNIGNWGVMGGGTHNDVVSAFVRGFVSDQPYGIEKWIDWDVDLHIKDDVSMNLDTPLSQFELGDAAQLLLSAYFEFAIEIEIDYPDLGNLDPGVGVNVKEADPQFGIYVLENREGRASGIVDPAHDELVTAPPTTTNGSDYQEGVALYRFDILHFDEFGVDLSDVLNPDVNVEIGTDSLQLDFLPENPTADPATERQPTKISLSSGHSTYEDRVSASTFELSKTRDQGGPEVTVKREIEDLIDANGELISDAVTLVVGLLDEFEDRLRDAFSGATSGGPRIPKLDVYAETPDGHRAGTDPETGEVVEEIDGGRVVQTMSRTQVTVPASTDVTFEVSDARLRSALESDGVEVPETVAYERSVIVDNDPKIVERDGAAYIEGRTVQRGPAAVGDDGRPALQSVSVDLDPAKINAKSNGEFVTGFIGVGSSDPEKLRLETVALEQVPAVTDETYGFVKNPPTETRDGETFVMVKFPRERVVERLGTGTHDVKITGLVEDITVYGTTEVTVFEPGNGNGNSGSGNGNGSNGSGGNGSNGNGNGNGN